MSSMPRLAHLATPIHAQLAESHDPGVERQSELVNVHATAADGSTHTFNLATPGQNASLYVSASSGDNPRERVRRRCPCHTRRGVRSKS